MWRGFALLLSLTSLKLGTAAVVVDSTVIHEVFTPSAPAEKTTASPLSISTDAWGTTAPLDEWTVTSWVKVDTVTDNDSVFFEFNTGASTITYSVNIFKAITTTDFTGQWLIFSVFSSPAGGLKAWMETWNGSSSMGVKSSGHESFSPSTAVLSIPSATGTAATVHVVNVKLREFVMNSYTSSIVAANEHCDQTCQGDCHGPGRSLCFKDDITCDPSCPQTCFGTGADQCISDSTRIFADIAESEISGLPILHSTDAKQICYRMALPETDCRIQGFQLVNPALASPASAWTLDRPQCIKYLDVSMPYYDVIYQKLFGALTFPEGSIWENTTEAKLKMYLKIWIIGFGYYELSKPEWTAFITLLTGVDYTNVGIDTNVDPPAMKIGSDSHPIPSKLAALIKAGGPDSNFFTLYGDD